jgi:hypothetical protein
MKVVCDDPIDRPSQRQRALNKETACSCLSITRHCPPQTEKQDRRCTPIQLIHVQVDDQELLDFQGNRHKWNPSKGWKKATLCLFRLKPEHKLFQMVTA